MEPFDCELFRDGMLAQPINSISALAFVGAAALLWNAGRRATALFAAAAGVGSFWFHASPSGASSWAHDISLYALIAVAVMELWQLVAARRPPVLAASIFLGGLVFWSLGRTTSPFCEPGALLQWHALWHVLAAASVVVLFAGRAVEPAPTSE